MEFRKARDRRDVRGFPRPHPDPYKPVEFDDGIAAEACCLRRRTIAMRVMDTSAAGIETEPVIATLHDVIDERAEMHGRKAMRAGVAERRHVAGELAIQDKMVPRDRPRRQAASDLFGPSDRVPKFACKGHSRPTPLHADTFFGVYLTSRRIDVLSIPTYGDSRNSCQEVVLTVRGIRLELGGCRIWNKEGFGRKASRNRARR